MIIVELKGGLGNQMFQYALGRHLAIKNKTSLVLDASGYKRDNLREYKLGVLNISARLANTLETKVFKRANKYQKTLNKLGLNYRYVVEKERYFNKSLLKLRGNIYLNGYWQSEKYFKDIGDMIRQDLTLKPLLRGKNKTIAKRMDECDSIGLHVRRGDYVSDPKTSKILVTCQPKYYYRAVKYITKKVRKPVFFIFSDEIGWAKKNLKFSYPTIYIDNNGSDKDYEDLRLMTICKHNIISNSTFSWWAAWLNTNKDKIVIAPKNWFEDVSINTKDLIPKSWTRI